MSQQRDFDRLVDIIKDSNSIVFFGGAGVSTESGIPDFRSKDGLYNQHDVQFDNYSPEYLLSHSCLRDNPRVFFEFYRQKLDTRTIEPNITHQVLAEMEQAGMLSAIVTQNIDGLHQKAGSRRVYEIHGTTQRNYCSECGSQVSDTFIFDAEANGNLDRDGIPRCPICGGIVRPYVTLYEEGLPDDAVSGAISAIMKADTMIIAGTSLNVYPAASYISYFQGRHMVVLNREPLNVKLDPDDDLFIEGNMGDAFRYIQSVLFNED